MLFLLFFCLTAFPLHLHFPPLYSLPTMLLKMQKTSLTDNPCHQHPIATSLQVPVISSSEVSRSTDKVSLCSAYVCINILEGYILDC